MTLPFSLVIWPLTSFTLTGGPLGNTPITFGESALDSATPAGSFLLAPTTLTLGGKEPAILEARFDASGYGLHLTGNVLPTRLLALASAVPQFGDGLSVLFLPPSRPPTAALEELPIHVDLISIRTWGSGQSWSRTTPAKPTRPKPHRH